MRKQIMFIRISSSVCCWAIPIDKPTGKKDPYSIPPVIPKSTRGHVFAHSFLFKQQPLARIRAI